jgi:hypothetical protein
MVTSGQGGKVMVRAVVLPSPFVTVTVDSGTGTLGSMVRSESVSSGTSMLDCESKSVVMGFSVMVMVVVVTTNVPPLLDPTSSDVVYGFMEMVVFDPTGLGGSTSVQGAVHCAVGLEKTSVPTYTTLSLPSIGYQTLISVVNPRWLLSW